MKFIGSSGKAQHACGEEQTMKIIVTGFEPFDGGAINPSWEAVSALNAPENVQLVKLQLPVVYGKAAEILLETMRRELPDAVVCVGLAEGRAEITPERVAINCRDESIPDNGGFFPHDEPVDAAGQPAYFTRLPVRRITEEIRKAGLPAKISNSAGVYVCNDLFYGLLRAIASEPLFKSVIGGFIHVPASTGMALPPSVPALEPEQILKGLQITIETVAR